MPLGFIVGFIGCEAQYTDYAVKEAAAERAAENEEASPERRIIYTGHLRVQVQDFDESRALFLALIEKHKGYITSAEVIGQTGTSRTANWSVRVPVADFQKFVDAASDLGVQESFRTESQDVTEEYVDLEARIKNKRIQEERLNEMMRTAEGKIEELLKLEQEITRVRGEIEQIQGRLNYLSRLTTMATVHVSYREVNEYRPPTAPGFGDQIDTAFSNSIGSLTTFGKNVVLFVVALAPWLPLILLLVGGLWFLIRRLARFTTRPARVILREDRPR